MEGPKGCGKSYNLTILFMMLQHDEPCLYLTQDSFHYPLYFLAFLEQHKKVFGKTLKQALRCKVVHCNTDDPDFYEDCREAVSLH